MTHRGAIKMRFPGSNSAYGFFSYYTYIVWPEVIKLFIIKGGPGTGKSTFMKASGQEMLEKGFNVEYHYCSANSRSLDGVTFPELGTGIIDGTAPHINDPVYPGAVDEIVDLGIFLHKKLLQENREEIIRLSRKKGEFFKAAYVFLSTAKQYLDAAEQELENKNIAHSEFPVEITGELVEGIFGSRKSSSPPLTRKLFISAITPQGPVNHLDNLAGSYNYVYVLTGENTTFKRRVIQEVREAARARKFDVEDFCCALDPYRTDHLGLPELDTVLINSTDPHFFPTGSASGSYKEIETDLPGTLPAEEVLETKSTFLYHYREAFKSGISMLQKAGEIHDEIETYYIEAMDFSAVENLRRNILESIL